MELSRTEYRRLVEDVAEAVLAKVIPFVKKPKKPEEQCTWVSTKEAAQIIGITEDHLLRLKDNFTYVKVGNSRNGRVKFRKETLVEEHIHSQKHRRRIPPSRKTEATPTGTEI